MKLKRNCIFFNSKVSENGRTPDWGQELGQGDGYLMKIHGCSEMINGLVQNMCDLEKFEYGNGGTKYKFQIVSVFHRINLKIYDSAKKSIEESIINSPFILLLVKENEGNHVGRRTLKMNKGFEYDNIKNSDFYNAINKIIPNPWFGYELNYDNIKEGLLTFSVIKAPITKPSNEDQSIRYLNAKERKSIWDKLANEYYKIDRNFKEVENKIFFGAPGTGKSYKINEIIEGREDRSYRVTFHPEYDYTSFVGGYKPTMHGNDIRYEFVPQIFTNAYLKAWHDLDNEYYLIIEEINRGNCSEIFGDIFQLLDRNNNYEVTPSEDLKNYLKKHLAENTNISYNVLRLPPNLNILATMNTSDQSLFPMDSAFKRRWKWEYIPINYEPHYKNHKGEFIENRSNKFRVSLTDSSFFYWIDFLKAVNSVIKNNQNLGMDKCIGNYFTIPSEDTITLETFINKVIFYMWDDVFKDEFEDQSIFKKNDTFEDFFPVEKNGLYKVKEMINSLDIDIQSF